MKITRTQIIMFRASILEKRILEKRILEKRAYESGTTTADFCRRAALGKEIGYRLSADEIEVLKTLTTTKLNFTRISNLIKDRKDIVPEVRQVIALINTQLHKLQ